MDAKPDRGAVITDSEECKGCGLCGKSLSAPKVLRLAAHHRDHNEGFTIQPSIRVVAARAAASAISRARSRAPSRCCEDRRRDDAKTTHKRQ